jgi:hypothetical protein
VAQRWELLKPVTGYPTFRPRGSLPVSEEAERDRVYGALRTVLVHLLKWQFQPAARSHGWRIGVVEARERILEKLADVPSLHGYAADQVDRAYRSALRLVEAETELMGLPEACPWTIEQLLDHGFWPGGRPGSLDMSLPVGEC